MKNLNWISDMSQGQGYSGSSEHIVVALSKLGIDVRVMSFGFDNKKNVTSQGLDVKQKPFSIADIGIAYGYPNSFSSLMFNKYKVGYTMFETTKLPSGVNGWTGPTGNWVDMLKDIDLLLTPSSFCAEVFMRNDCTVPIKVVPLGVDIKTYKYIERPKRKVFTFLMLGTLTIRKNPGYVISAFLNLFKNNENVRLILKTQDGTLGSITFPHKNLIIIDRRSTNKEVMQYLYDADCFIFPSRGEGFGLPPLEAMATGLPTILSANTGMKDFCNEEYNYPIRKMTPQPAQRFPRAWGYVGNWFDPDPKELQYLMEYVYAHQDEAREKGRLGAEWVKNNWTFDNTANKLIKTLQKTLLNKV